MRLQQVGIRRFIESDIPLKVRWINDDRNNQYLHYDLPLTIEGTLRWFQKYHQADDRLDCTILYDNTPVGIIGLLHIDRMTGNAEYYITLGEFELRGQGIAEEASKLLFKLAKSELQLSSLYLSTEQKNLRAQSFFEKIGFKVVDIHDIESSRKYLFEDRLLYIIDL